MKYRNGGSKSQLGFVFGRNKKQFTKRCLALLAAVLVVPYLSSRCLSVFRYKRVAWNQQATASSSNAKSTLKVCAYNIAHGRGLATSNWDGGTKSERHDRLRQMASLLRTHQPDIVVLNEVDFDCSWSDGVNQAEFLARKAAYPFWAEQRNVDVRVLGYRWKFGNAILSKYKILSAQVIQLPGLRTWEVIAAGKKRALACQIEFPGKPLTVIAAHLSHRSEYLRVESVLEIANRFDSAIIAGDFNSTPSGFPKSLSDQRERNAIDCMDVQKSYVRHAPNFENPAELTFRSYQPQSIIDWIFIPAEHRFRNYQILSSLLSDHRPVLADIEIRSGSGGI